MNEQTQLFPMTEADRRARIARARNLYARMEIALQMRREYLNAEFRRNYSPAFASAINETVLYAYIRA